MYDKRYTEAHIKSIRWWAGAKMFLCMVFLVYAVGKVCYASGYSEGYHHGHYGVGAKQQEAPVAKSMRLDIEVLAEPGDQTPMQARLNWILQYWIIGAVAVAIWAAYKFFTYPRRNVAKVKGEGNVIIQSHSGLYPPDTHI